MKNRSLSEQVMKNSFWSSSLAILTKLGGLIFSIVLVKFLVPESFGAYSLALATVFIVMAFADLGLNQALVIFFSNSITTSKNKANSYFKYLFKIKLYASLAITLILILASYFFAKYLFSTPDITLLIIFGAIYSFFFSLSSFFVGFFYIYKKTKLDLLKEFIFQVIRLGLVLLAFFILPQEYHLVSIFIILIIVSILILGYSLYYSKRLAPFIFKLPSVQIDKIKLLSFLFYLTIISVSLIIFSQIDIIMIGAIVKDLSFLAYYQSSIILVLGVVAIMSITPVLLPVLSSVKDKAIKPAFEKVIKYTLILTIPSCVGLIILGKYFIKAFFRAEYLTGISAFYILSLLIVSEPLTNLFSTLFSARKKPKFIATSLVISTLLNIILNYILISSLLKISLVWAISGAAIATLISRLLLTLTLFLYSRREFKISINPGYWIKPLLSSLVMAIWLYFISRSINVSIVSGALILVSGAIIYAISMFIMKGINKQDISTFLLLFKR